MSNLASPLFSFGSGDRAGIVLNDIDGDGYTLLAALERGTDMDRKPVNVINSLYGLEHPAEWIKNQIDSGNEFALYDEKKEQMRFSRPTATWPRWEMAFALRVRV